MQTTGSQSNGKYQQDKKAPQQKKQNKQKKKTANSVNSEKVIKTQIFFFILVTFEHISVNCHL